MGWRKSCTNIWLDRIYERRCRAGAKSSVVLVLLAPDVGNHPPPGAPQRSWARLLIITSRWEALTSYGDYWPVGDRQQPLGECHSANRHRQEELPLHCHPEAYPAQRGNLIGSGWAVCFAWAPIRRNICKTIERIHEGQDCGNQLLTPALLTSNATPTSAPQILNNCADQQNAIIQAACWSDTRNSRICSDLLHEDWLTGRVLLSEAASMAGCHRRAGHPVFVHWPSNPCPLLCRNKRCDRATFSGTAINCPDLILVISQTRCDWQLRRKLLVAQPVGNNIMPPFSSRVWWNTVAIAMIRMIFSCAVATVMHPATTPLFGHMTRRFAVLP